MALSPKQKDYVLSVVAQQAGGTLNSEIVIALTNTLERLQATYDLPDLAVAVKTSVDETPQEVLGAAARLYAAVVVSPADATTDCLVRFTDNDVVFASLTCTKEKPAAALFLGGTQGVGIPTVTDLEVEAVQTAGGGNLATASEPKVIVVYGVS